VRKQQNEEKKLLKPNKVKHFAERKSQIKLKGRKKFKENLKFRK
jgi:hypothetical protein